MISLSGNPVSELNEYELKHFVSHCIEAGDYNKLHRLFALETPRNNNAWFEAKEFIGDISGFFSDVQLAWEQTDKEYSQSPAKTIGLQCRYALIYTSLNTLSSQIPKKLMAELVKRGVWTQEQGLSYALHIVDLEHKIQTLLELAGVLSKSLREIAFKSILDTSEAIQSEYVRARTLEALVDQLPEHFMLVLSASAKKIENYLYRSIVINALEQSSNFRKANDLTQKTGKKQEKICLDLSQDKSSDVNKDFERVIKIKSEISRAEALVALAPRLSDNLLEEVLELLESNSLFTDFQLIKEDDILPLALSPYLLLLLVQIRHSGYCYSIVLNALAPYILKKQIPKFFDLISLIKIDNFAESLNSLYPDQLEIWSLKLIKEIEAEFECYRFQALDIIAPRLSTYMLEKVLDELVIINDGFYLSLARNALNSQALIIQMEETLDKVNSITSSKVQAELLVDLAPKIPSVLLKKFLEVIHTQISVSLEPALIAIIPRLPINLIHEALEIALSIYIKDHNFAGKALIEIASKLDSVLIKRVLDTVQTTSRTAGYIDSYEVPLTIEIVREYVSCQNIEDQPLNLFTTEILEAVSIRDELERACALFSLLPFCRKLLPLVYNATITIPYKDIQGVCLGILSLYFPTAANEALEAFGLFQGNLDVFRRFEAFAETIPLLNRDLIQGKEVLKIVRDIQDEFYQLNAVNIFMPLLNAEEKQEAFKIVQNMQLEIGIIPEFYRQEVLAKLMLNLSENLLVASMEKISDLSEDFLSSLLYEIGTDLPLTSLCKALEVVQRFESKPNRIVALQGIKSNLINLSDRRQLFVILSKIIRLDTVPVHLGSVVFPDLLVVSKLKVSALLFPDGFEVLVVVS